MDTPSAADQLVGWREACVAGLAALLLATLYTGPGRLLRPHEYPFDAGDPTASTLPYLMRSFGEAASPAGAWDDTMGTGLPEGHSPFGRYYPPLVVLCGLFPVGLAVTLSLILHHAFAALGAYLLTRDAGRSRGAAAAAAVVLAFGGFLAFRRPHVTLFHAAVWLPWVIWSLERWRRQGRPVWVLTAGSLLALHALAGNPQLVVIGATLWLFHAAWFTVLGTGGGIGRGRFLVGELAACTLGAVGSLPQMLPLFEVAGWSEYHGF